MQLGEDGWEILTAPEDLAHVAKAVEAKGLTVTAAEFIRIPKTMATVSDDDAPKVQKILDVLDDQDDVQNIYSNVEFSDAFLESQE